MPNVWTSERLLDEARRESAVAEWVWCDAWPPRLVERGAAKYSKRRASDIIIVVVGVGGGG